MNIFTFKNFYAGKQNRRRTKKRIPMNCSPAVKKISVHNSCYTPKILFMIRDAYNKDHSAEDKIEESDPTKLWKVLNERFVQCKKEDCWLNEIKDAALKKRIDRYIFAPDKPYEWKKNPNEWLSNFDIMNVLEQYEQTYKHFEFIGPTPIDFDAEVNGRCIQSELCKFDLESNIKNGKTHIGTIFNLSPHTSSGSHWVSLFIDTKERVIFFFDSAGDPMPNEIKVLVKRIQKQARKLTGSKYEFYQNSPKEHQMGNTECGVYSLFFIITMLTGSSPLVKGKMSMKQKIYLFKRRTIPDKYIEKYRNVYFND
jgi:hypothetical protein